MNIKFLLISSLFLNLSLNSVHANDELTIIDTHIHYSHDAWERLPPEKALAVLKNSGLKKAFVSSSSDEGTQKLYALDKEFIVPVLRPYRKRGELYSWMHDLTVIDMLKEKLAKNHYAGIGEFHAFDDEIHLPVLQSVINLAKQYGIFLLAHSDKEAIKLIFEYNPDALVIWAHSGFDNPETISQMLKTYPNLWTDLAFRFEHDAYIAGIEPEWKKLFLEYPDRILLGTDTFAPERWYYVEEHANEARRWLQDLPLPVREMIAYKNAENLLSKVKNAQNH